MEAQTRLHNVSPADHSSPDVCNGLVGPGMVFVTLLLAGIQLHQCNPFGQGRLLLGHDDGQCFSYSNTYRFTCTHNQQQVQYTLQCM